jgi:hypothetical protein
MLSRRWAKHRRVQRVLGGRGAGHITDIPGTLSAPGSQLPLAVSPLRIVRFVETTSGGSSPFSTQRHKDKVAMNPILSLNQESSARAASAYSALSQSTLYRGKALPKTALRRGQPRAGPDGSSSVLGAPASSGRFAEGPSKRTQPLEPTMNPLLSLRLPAPMTYTTVDVSARRVVSDSQPSDSEVKESPKVSSRRPLSRFSSASRQNRSVL